MTIEEQRTAIAKVYPSEKWQRKVENMPEDQVIALYLSFEKRGILNAVITKPYQRNMETIQKAKRKQLYESESYQITIEDISTKK